MIIQGYNVDTICMYISKHFIYYFPQQIKLFFASSYNIFLLEKLITFFLIWVTLKKTLFSIMKWLEELCKTIFHAM